MHRQIAKGGKRLISARWYGVAILMAVEITTFLLLLAAALPAQQNQSTTTTVPRLVRISNTFRPADGQAPASVENVTLSIYRDEQGGSPLWQEAQNVPMDADGRYNILMGATLDEGIPVELFGSSEARWLGVKFNRTGEVEQPRTRLASVPYALRASDSETLGGRPASAYLLADPAEAPSVTAAAAGPGAKAVATPKTISGLQGYIPVFTDATNDLGDSVMQQANGDIGVGTVPGAGASTTPSLDLRTYPFSQIGMGQTADYLTFFASDTYGPAIYWDPAKDLRFGKGGTGLYNAYGFAEQMRLQSSTGNLGIGTMTPGQKLDVVGNVNLSGSLLFGENTILTTSGTPGYYNTGVGLFTLPSNTGVNNTASGSYALFNNTSGTGNTAIGSHAMYTNAGAGGNTAVGFQALYSISTGANSNTAVGAFSGGTGNGSIAIGYQAGSATTGSFNIDLFDPGVSGESGVTRIGSPSYQSAFFAAGIVNTTVSGVPVLVSSGGQLGVAASSRRYKEDIQDMGSASDGLMRLRPVTFRYKKAFDDGTKPIQYGLIAEEVDEVYPDLVAHSTDGQIETVKYQALAPMLLNEVQKQAAEIKELKDRLAKLEALLAATADRR